MSRKKKSRASSNKNHEYAYVREYFQSTETVKIDSVCEIENKNIHYHILFLVIIASLIGQIWQTSVLSTLALYTMTAAAYISFFAMSLVKDHSGGRFILSSGQIFGWCASAIFTSITPEAKICHMLLFLLIPLYFTFSMASFMKHYRNRTLNLLPGTIFKASKNI